MNKDNLKRFYQEQKGIEDFETNDQNFSQDIGMKFGIEKCEIP